MGHDKIRNDKHHGNAKGDDAKSEERPDTLGERLPLPPKRVFHDLPPVAVGVDVYLS